MFMSVVFFGSIYKKSSDCGVMYKKLLNVLILQNVEINSDF